MGNRPLVNRPRTSGGSTGASGERRGRLPTGVAIHDAREQLFDAAQRVLLRDGPSALTSRAITNEAGCAKGVLHRHFADFDAFLAGLVTDRIARIDDQAASLRTAAGTGTVAGNLTGALITVFEAVALAIVGLVIFRDDLRAQLRNVAPTGVPVLTEATAMIASYLTAEQDLGRITPDADIETLAPTLIGAGHLLFAGRGGTEPDMADVRRVVHSVVAGVVREPRAGQNGARRADP
jgi:AcrR family transcriptional regulator